jgi:preprotein translocase subunit SecE
MTKVLDFLTEVKVELEKVVWPNSKNTFKLTVMVIVVTLIVGFFIGGIDYLLVQLTQLLLN